MSWTPYYGLGVLPWVSKAFTKNLLGFMLIMGSWAEKHT